MEAIKEVVAKVLKKLSQKINNSPEDNPEAWLKKALTKKELEHIKFNYFKKGSLGLIVDSSSWLYMLSIKKGALLKNLQKLSNNIKEVHFRIGEIN